MWANGARDQSLTFLRGFSQTLSQDLEMQISERPSRPGVVARQKLDELQRLLARCYFKQGQWREALKESWTKVSNVLMVLIFANSHIGRHRRHSKFLPTSYRA